MSANLIISLNRKNAELEARVAELEHSLSDAMEQIEAIQGSNATHMARVAELESELKWCRELLEGKPDQSGKGEKDAN